MKSELLNCPFCGGDDLSLQNGDSYASDGAGNDLYFQSVWCADCRAEGGSFPEHQSDEAITAWNARAPDPAERAQGFIEGLDAAAAVAANCFGPSYEDEASTCEVVAAAIRALSPGKAKP